MVATAMTGNDLQHDRGASQSGSRHLSFPAHLASGAQAPIARRMYSRPADADLTLPEGVVLALDEVVELREAAVRPVNDVVAIDTSYQTPVRHSTDMLCRWRFEPLSAITLRTRQRSRLRWRMLRAAAYSEFGVQIGIMSAGVRTWSHHKCQMACQSDPWDPSDVLCYLQALGKSASTARLAVTVS